MKLCLQNKLRMLPMIGPLIDKLCGYGYFVCLLSGWALLQTLCYVALCQVVFSWLRFLECLLRIVFPYVSWSSVELNFFSPNFPIYGYSCILWVSIILVPSDSGLGLAMFFYWLCFIPRINSVVHYFCVFIFIGFHE